MCALSRASVHKNGDCVEKIVAVLTLVDLLNKGVLSLAIGLRSSAILVSTQRSI